MRISPLIISLAFLLPLQVLFIQFSYADNKCSYKPDCYLLPFDVFRSPECQKICDDAKKAMEEGYDDLLNSLLNLKLGTSTRSYGSECKSYDVSVYGDSGSGYGTVNSCGGGMVTGYIQLDNGLSSDFNGNWSGRGEIVGTDTEGNWYSLYTE